MEKMFAGFASVNRITAVIGNDIFELILGQSMDFKPGQFLTIRCGEETISPRPFSIFRSIGEKTTILFKVKGLGTEWLARRREGEQLYVVGPLGNHFTLPPEQGNLVFVAGGMGIVPLAAIIERTLGQAEIVLVYGVKTEEELVEIGFPNTIDYHRVTEDGSFGEKGLATDILPKILRPVEKNVMVYACGPRGMLAKLQEILPSDIPCQVALETILGCGGQGRCFGCAVPIPGGGYELLCQEGPVFDLRELKLNEYS